MKQQRHDTTTRRTGAARYKDLSRPSWHCLRGELRPEEHHQVGNAISEQNPLDAESRSPHEHRLFPPVELEGGMILLSPLTISSSLFSGIVSESSYVISLVGPLMPAPNRFSPDSRPAPQTPPWPAP